MNPDYQVLIKEALDRYETDPKDTTLIDFIVASLILDILKDTGLEIE